MIIKFNFGNNNYFYIKLYRYILYGDLYLYISEILNVPVTNILYLLFNGNIIDNNISNKYNFNNKINIYINNATVNIIFKNFNNKSLYDNYNSYDENNILYQYQFWLNINKNLTINDLLINDSSINNINITLTENEYNNLITLVNINDINENDSNIICICGNILTHDNELIAYLPCSHLFHNKCIKKYFTETNIKCPCCNEDIRNYIK